MRPSEGAAEAPVNPAVGARRRREIFIGGCPRSGTTLLGAMLGAHSRCVVTPESDFKFKVLVDGDIGWATLKRDSKARAWGVGPGDGGEPGEPGPARLAGAELLWWMVERYSGSSTREGETVWVDHTPRNLRHAAVLAEAFPNARFIHLLRDGRAVAASVREVIWGPNTVLHAADWWVSHVAHGLAASQFLGSARIMNVRYEDLVESPERTLKQVCDFVGLEFESDMVQGRGYDVPAYSKGQHALVGKDPQARRVSAWRGLLSDREIELFEAKAGELLELTGYRVVHPAPRRGPTRLEQLRFAVEGEVRRLRNRRAKNLRRRTFGA